MAFLSGGKRSLRVRRLSSFSAVPTHSPPDPEQLSGLQAFLDFTPQGKLLVLTGAGLSTESGIPDYRSEGVGLYARSNRRPIQNKVFMGSPSARQSYWARNFVGWPRWQGLSPNAGHKTLSEWEKKGKLSHLITQNVDQLHYKAGSTKLIELHGTNSLVACTSCSYKITRQAFQKALREVNRTFSQEITEEMIRPDGDMDIPEDQVRRFVVPGCPRCVDGILKPWIVFFGDSVPQRRVETVRRLVQESSALLVIGSSLQVYSGYRIALQAKEEVGRRLAILNIGPTRADHMADVVVNARAGEVLAKMRV